VAVDRLDVHPEQVALRPIDAIDGSPDPFGRVSAALRAMAHQTDPFQARRRNLGVPLETVVKDQLIPSVERNTIPSSPTARN